MVWPSQSRHLFRWQQSFGAVTRFIDSQLSPLPVLAVIEEWTLTALPIRFWEEDFLLDSLPYALN